MIGTINSQTKLSIFKYSKTLKGTKIINTINEIRFVLNFNRISPFFCSSKISPFIFIVLIFRFVVPPKAICLSKLN